jgi:zinc D-Ala-D-Ala carboxypeptidase
MKLSKDFPLHEMLKSQSATRFGIENTPLPKHLESMKTLAEKVLQPVRDALGVIVVNSGYRSPQLNAVVGGSTTSQHSLGEAADIESKSFSNLALAQWIARNLEFDQLILEGYDGKDPRSGWVHVSYREGRNRKEMMTARFVPGKKTIYTHVDLTK